MRKRSGNTLPPGKKNTGRISKRRDIKGQQYQKVLSHDDITHCSHGLPYGPNSGGLYPSASAVGTTCSCLQVRCASHGTHEACETASESRASLLREARLRLSTSRSVERLYYTWRGMSRKNASMDDTPCPDLTQVERTLTTPPIPTRGWS